MVLLRHIALCVLIAGLMPWGAWTGERFAPWARQAHVVALSDAAAEPVQAQVVRAVKHCRIGVLPGACGVDGGLLAAMRMEPPVLREVVHVPEVADLRAGLSPGAPTDPPRLI